MLGNVDLGEVVSLWYKNKSARAKLTYYQFDKVIWISHFSATDRRQGHGRNLLEQICAVADEMGYGLELRVGRFDKGGPSNRQLMQFYAQFGFQSWQPGEEEVMARKIYGPYNEPHYST